MSIVTPVPALAFDPGGYQATGYGSDVNLITTATMLQREFDPILYRPFAESFSVMLDILGMKKVVTNSTLVEHAEEGRVYPKLFVANPAGAAGASVTFTYKVPTSPGKQNLLAQEQNSPYAPTDPASYYRGFTAAVGMVIQIPASSTADVTTMWINSVDEAAGTFTALPMDEGDSTSESPSSGAAGREIIVVGNAFGEQSDQDTPFYTIDNVYSNTHQIVKHTGQCSGTLAALTIYASDGKKYMIREEPKHYRTHVQKVDNALLFGKQVTNPLITTPNKKTPVQGTKGLVTQALAGGTVQTYTSGTYGLTEIAELTLEMDLVNAATENFMLEGTVFGSDLNRGIITTVQNGAVSYGAFGNDANKAINLDFKSFTFNKKTFHRKGNEYFSNYQHGGADGYNYRKDCIIMPAEQQLEKDGSMGWSIRKRFTQGRELIVTPRKMTQIADNGKDADQITYLSEVCLEVMGVNKLLYITTA
jgi:hypothetical protein